MASRLYDKGRNRFLTGSIDYLTDTIKASLVDGAVYTPDTAVDEFFDDIASVISTATLGGKTAVDGVADADDTNFVSVSGAQFEYIVIWQDTTVAATSPLIAVIDTATGLPFTPSGADVLVAWDNGADKIFKL
jgi:hypothetical protein